ncbi:MAG: shikimate kinase [Candidatus Helarchaeota archaeon]
MKTNIALIGFMGTGKTHIGKLLAEKLKKKFIETDKIIEELAGKTIPAIFAEDGEIRFREYEIEACKSVAKQKNVVIACGGGVVLNKINIDYLKQDGVVFCLEATPHTILERTMKDGKESRPLLNNPDPEKSIRDLLEFRAPFYSAAADYKVDTNRSSEEIISEIIRIFEEIRD